MGEVYRARDPRINREVAIKLLPAAYNTDADRLRRFEQEARTAGSISHPNLVTIYDIGSDNGAPYIVMELLDGETLRDRMAEGVPQRKAIEYATQIANGLAAAHDKGIVHRDLKPENIFVTRDGRVKILDFGLAKLTADALPTAQSATLARDTSPGTVLGTAGYMSPEQVRGESLDSRTDVFAFGAILYEMLSGRRAFSGGSSADTMSAILREDPADLPRVSPTLQHIVQHCLEKRREERFQSARDLAFDLQTASGASSTSGPAIAQPRRAQLPWIWLAVGIIGGLGAAIAYRAGKGQAAAPGVATAPKIHVSQLTFQSGVESFPSIAPDGKTFVYTSKAAGNDDIYLQRIDGRNAINLTKDSPADDNEASYSPDGSQIAFRSERDGGGIFIMGATGESVKRLTDFGFNPSWSPDGKSILCSTENVIFSPQARATNSEIWIVDVASGQKRRLTNEFRGAQAVWSPHGYRVAFWGLLPNAQRDIYTMDPNAAGARPKQLTNDAALDWNPVWSHDGKYIYFGSDRGGTMNLWRIPVEEKTGDAVGAAEAIPLPARFAGHFSIAQDDRHIIFSALEMASAILRAPLGDVRGFPLMRGSMLIFSFDISPDGQSVAFSNSGLQEDLYVAKIDGSDLRQITNDPDRDRAPTWTPDGRQLLFYSTRGGSRGYEVWRINVDGSGLVKLTDKIAESLWFPRISPDGKKITATGFEDNYVIPLADNPPTKKGEVIAHPPGSSLRFIPLSWAPDSRQVAGVLARATDREPAGGVYIYDTVAKTFTKVRDTGARVRWLRDGHTLVIQDGGALYVTDLNTKQVRQYPFPEHTSIISKWADPFWTDGKSACWVEQLNEADVWLVTLDK